MLRYYSEDEHREHMTDGRWHDDCLACIQRRSAYTPMRAGSTQAGAKGGESNE